MLPRSWMLIKHCLGSFPSNSIFFTKELWLLALIWGTTCYSVALMKKKSQTHLALFMPLRTTLVSWVKNAHYWLFAWKVVEESADVCALQLGSALSAEITPSSAQILLSFWGEFWCSLVWGANSYRIASKKMYI